MLQMMITKKIGAKAYHFTAQGANLFEVVTEADRLSFPDVTACGLCGSNNLSLSARQPKGKFKYVSIKCLDCRGDLTFGKMQEDENTYFLRRNDAKELDWRAYTPEAQ